MHKTFSILKTKVLLIFLLLKLSVIAQNFNIVPNPSFEITTNCYPGAGGNFQNIVNWYNPTQCSPDLYALCGDTVIPSLTSDIKRHKGYNRIGVIVYDSLHINENVREYVANKFIATLKAGKQYCFSSFIIPAKGFKYGSDKFGVYFGTGAQNYSVACGYIPVIPQLSFPTGIFINDTSTWYNFKGIYTAQGGESDIVIGSFTDDANTNLQVINNFIFALQISYFVIDDVSLHEMSVKIGNDTTVCAGDDFTIGEQNLDTAFNAYYWYHNGVLFDSIVSQKTINLMQADSFVLEKRLPCGSVFDTIHINVLNDCAAQITTPNVFTPNNDGMNDNFELRMKNVELNTFEIYNRWGVSVFKSPSQPINKSTIVIWDGRTTSGVACSDGVYYYVLKAKDKNGEEISKRGYITLIR